MSPLARREYESETQFEMDRVEDVRNVTIYTHPVLTYGHNREAIRAWCEVAGIEMTALL